MNTDRLRELRQRHTHYRKSLLRYELDLDGLVDKEAQKRDLECALAKVEKQFGAVDGKLSNESFVSRAPEEIVAKERARRDELGAERDRLAQLLAALDG